MEFKTKAVRMLLCISVLTLGGTLERARAADLSVSMDNGIKIIKNVPYAGAADNSRELNLYLPQATTATKLPLIVLIHGGGWSAGDKNDFDSAAKEFVERGYAAASLNYRLSQQAIFPAQIIDCKAALRWLRAHASDYGLDPTRIVVGGHSAGGHLAALIGATAGVKQFDRGTDLNQRSDVQAVIWLAGVGDLVSRTLAPGFESEQDPHSGESLLIGGPVLQTIARANAASPMTYVSRRSPPYIFFHGDSDRAVPVGQAIEMYTALLRCGVSAELHILKGADHGGPGYFTPLMFDQIDTFLDKALTRTSLSAQTSLLSGGAYTIAPVSAPHLVLAATEAADAPGGIGVGIAAPYLNAANQLWIFQAQGDGYYTLHPSDNRMLALTVTPGTLSDTTKVVLMRDGGQPNQRWKVHWEINGKCLLTPQAVPGSALDNFGGATTPGSSVDIFSDSGYDPHLQWRMTPAR